VDLIVAHYRLRAGIGSGYNLAFFQRRAAAGNAVGLQRCRRRLEGEKKTLLHQKKFLVSNI
jgi:hypothetical protein